MKIFRLNRKEDTSGVSGTGIVAVGVEFDSGKCVLVWKTDKSITEIADSISVIEEIHGHGGKSIVEIFDPKLNGRYYKNLQDFLVGKDLSKHEKVTDQ